MGESKETFSDIVLDVEEGFVLALRQMQICLQELADGFRRHVAECKDIPVLAEQQDAKKGILRLWREQAQHFDFLARAIDRTPVDAQRLRDEVREMLLRGALLSEQEVPWSPSTVRAFIDERSRNIAAAYAGRVIPE